MDKKITIKTQIRLQISYHIKNGKTISDISNILSLPENCIRWLLDNPKPQTRRNKTNLQKDIIFSPEQIGILIGVILGDGHIKKTSKGWNITMEQKDYDYVYHLYLKLQNFINHPPRLNIRRVN